MVIGTVRECKNNEFRVGLTPDNVRAYRAAGSDVLVETGAGLGSGYEDEEYAKAGAAILPNAASVWERADMGKVKRSKRLSSFPFVISRA